MCGALIALCLLLAACGGSGTSNDDTIISQVQEKTRAFCGYPPTASVVAWEQ